MNHPLPQIRSPATYQDVLDAPANMVAELVNGALHLHPRPAARANVGVPRRGRDRVERGLGRRGAVPGHVAVRSDREARALRLDRRWPSLVRRPERAHLEGVCEQGRRLEPDHGAKG